MIIFLMVGIIGLDFNSFDIAMTSIKPIVTVKEYSEEFLVNMVKCDKCQISLVADGTFTEEEMAAIVKKGKAIAAIKSIGKEPKQVITVQPKTVQPIIVNPAPTYRIKRAVNYCPTCPY